MSVHHNMMHQFYLHQLLSKQWQLSLKVIKTNSIKQAIVIRWKILIVLVFIFLIILFTFIFFTKMVKMLLEFNQTFVIPFHPDTVCLEEALVSKNSTRCIKVWMSIEPDIRGCPFASRYISSNRERGRSFRNLKCRHTLQS